MINIKVDAHGPLFTGQLQRQIPHALFEAQQEVATVGADHLRGDLGRPPFIKPTGWYRSHITPKLLGALWTIWDSGVVYGPWLAGTSTRNHTSRFKGYAHWRRAIAHTNRIARPITEKIIARNLRGMS